MKTKECYSQEDYQLFLAIQKLISIIIEFFTEGISGEAFTFQKNDKCQNDCRLVSSNYQTLNGLFVDFFGNIISILTPWGVVYIGQVQNKNKRTKLDKNLATINRLAKHIGEKLTGYHITKANSNGPSDNEIHIVSTPGIVPTIRYSDQRLPEEAAVELWTTMSKKFNG